MADLSSLAPLIFGGAFALAGAVSLWWMNTHAPQLQLPAPSEEGARDPFDSPRAGEVIVTVKKRQGRKGGGLQILPRRLIESTVFGVPRKVSDKQNA